VVLLDFPELVHARREVFPLFGWYKQSGGIVVRLSNLFFVFISNVLGLQKIWQRILDVLSTCKTATYVLILLVNDFFWGCHILLDLCSWRAFYFANRGWKAWNLFCGHYSVIKSALSDFFRLVLQITFNVSRTYLEILRITVLFHHSLTSSLNALIFKVFLWLLGLVRRRPFFSQNLSLRLSLVDLSDHLDLSSGLHNVFWCDGIFLLLGLSAGYWGA